MAHYLQGASMAEAARKAGYGGQYADHAHDRIFNRPEVRALVEQGRQAIRERTAYTVEKACEDTAKDIEFARAKGNPMAVMKGRELLCKLNGLLVDRVEATVGIVDVAGALAEARARVGRRTFDNETGEELAEILR